MVRNSRRAVRYAGASERRSKVRKLLAHVALAGVLAEGLVKRWSPAKVAVRLILDHFDVPEMRVSHETIYPYRYLLVRSGLKRELIAGPKIGLGCVAGHADEATTPYEPNVLGSSPRSAPERPRRRLRLPRDREGDLIMGAFNSSALVTVALDQQRRQPQSFRGRTGVRRIRRRRLRFVEEGSRRATASADKREV